MYIYLYKSKFNNKNIFIKITETSLTKYGMYIQ